MPEFDAEEIIGAAGSRRVAAFYAFWLRARGPHPFPGQADLDLMSIPKLLPSLFILDALGVQGFRCRFVGSRIDEHLGTGMTGRTLGDLPESRARTEVVSFFRTVVEQRALGLLQTQLPSERFEWVRYTRLGLPLADDHVTVNKVVGLFLFEPAVADFTGVPTMRDVDNDELGTVKSRFGRLPPPGL